MEAVMIPTKIWETLTDKGLLSDAIKVYLWSASNPLTTLHGLYEVRIGQIARSLVMHNDDVLQNLRILTGESLLVWDRELMFVPMVPKARQFERYNNANVILTKALSLWHDAKGLTGGPNKSLVAWATHHRNHLRTIEPAHLHGIMPTWLGGPLGPLAQTEGTPTHFIEGSYLQGSPMTPTQIQEGSPMTPTQIQEGSPMTPTQIQ